MRAVGFDSNIKNLPSAFIEMDQPDPLPKEFDLKVRVKAVSINPVDYKIRDSAAVAEGEFKILGWDSAGIVESIGTNVKHFKCKNLDLV